MRDLKIGDRVVVNGYLDGEYFENERGTIEDIFNDGVLNYKICFDDWYEGWGDFKRYWNIYGETMSIIKEEEFDLIQKRLDDEKVDMAERGFVDEYKYFIETKLHEVLALDYIKERAMNEKGFELYNPRLKYRSGDKIIFESRNKIIALVELGMDLSDGSNLIVSHIDAPRLDIIPNNPIEVNDDGVFFKTQSYGGIIPQLFLDRPLVMVGRAYDDNGDLVTINTINENIFFSVTSLLPHLQGRKEVKEMTSEKLKVRMSNGNKEDFEQFFDERYGLTLKNLELAELSFVPFVISMDMGFDKDLITGYSHDDSSCTFASLEAMLDSEDNKKTKIFLATSYEETGSHQSSGAVSQFIDDIFLMLADGNILLARECIRNTKVISADVTSGFDSNYSNHFELNAKAVCGKGVAIVPYTGSKRGNDSTIEMRHHIEKLCKDNDIKYQVETTKVTESGGGTVAMFFGVRGCEVIDVGVAVLAMHSPQELISKKDLYETYKLYKVFLES